MLDRTAEFNESGIYLDWRVFRDLNMEEWQIVGRGWIKEYLLSLLHCGVLTGPDEVIEELRDSEQRLLTSFHDQLTFELGPTKIPLLELLTDMSKWPRHWGIVRWPSVPMGVSYTYTEATVLYRHKMKLLQLSQIVAPSAKVVAWLPVKCEGWDLLESWGAQRIWEDELWCTVLLPSGWRRKNEDDKTSILRSNLIDEQGRTRARIRASIRIWEQWATMEIVPLP